MRRDIKHRGHRDSQSGKTSPTGAPCRTLTMSPRRLFTASPRLQNGSAMLETLLGTTILLAFLIALFRLGIHAVNRQTLQTQVDNRAWSAAFKVEPASSVPAVENEWLGWRARDKATGVHSLRVDRGNP